MLETVSGMAPPVSKEEKTNDSQSFAVNNWSEVNVLRVFLATKFVANNFARTFRQNVGAASATFSAGPGVIPLLAPF
jgi:hypothetical protein